MIRIGATRVVLGTDQATSSGYCIHVGSSPVKHGVVTTAHGRRTVVSLAQQYASEYGHADGAWFLFVYEDHSGFGHAQRGHGTLIGALHRWLEHLDLLGHPVSMRIGVAPSTWQRSVLGVVSSKVRSEERKTQAMRWATHHVKTPVTHSDQADAIAISAWGVLDGTRRAAVRQHKSTYIHLLGRGSKRTRR